MSHACRLNRLVAVCVLVVTTLQTAGCGTILYPERRGQTSGKIDPGVAILDGVGILLYVIPGLIAFGIDFSTGAIYLPHGKRGDAGRATRVVRLDPAALTRQSIDDVIARETGYTAVLERPGLRVTRVQDPARFLSEYSERERARN